LISVGSEVQILPGPPMNDGGLAQLGEHLLCKQGVVGSIPTVSTNWIMFDFMVWVVLRLGWDLIVHSGHCLGNPSLADKHDAESCVGLSGRCASFGKLVLCHGESGSGTFLDVHWPSLSDRSE
jgi:hypothetical protein